MKQNYLDQLRDLLTTIHEEDEDQLSEEKLESLMKDYQQLYDEGLADGKSEEEIEDKLGNPEKVIAALGLHQPEKKRWQNKIVALSPFVSVVIFLAIGLIYGVWHPTWLVFLLIPVTAIILDYKENGHILTPLSPFVAVTAFILLGTYYDLWHPAWLVFLIIPILGILEGKEGTTFYQKVLALSPFVITTFVFLVYFDNWLIGWLYFLIIPFLALFGEKNLTKRFLFQGALLVSVAGYLYLGLEMHRWDLSYYPFLLVVILWLGQKEVLSSILKKITQYEGIVILVSLIVFILIGWLNPTGWGYAPSGWSYSWLVFLLVPLFIVSKQTKGHARIIAATPFLSTIAYFLIGFSTNQWGLGTLVFLTIPVTAIILEA